MLIEKKLKGKDLSDAMKVYAVALSQELFDKSVKDLDYKQFELLVTRVKGDYWFKGNYQKTLTEEGFRCRLERSFEREIKRRKLNRDQKTVLFGFGDTDKKQIAVYEQKTAQKSEPKTETKNKVNMQDEKKFIFESTPNLTNQQINDMTLICQMTEGNADGNDFKPVQLNIETKNQLKDLGFEMNGRCYHNKTRLFVLDAQTFFGFPQDFLIQGTAQGQLDCMSTQESGFISSLAKSFFPNEVQDALSK